MNIIDRFLFWTNICAGISCWTFFLYYIIRFRWEVARIGRYIILGTGALTALVTTGLLRRLDTRFHVLYLAPEINILSCLCYAAVAVVFGMAAYLLIKDARRIRREEQHK